MEAKVSVKAGPEETLVLDLDGQPGPVLDLIRRLREVGGPLSVRGGKCCWTLSREGATIHVVLDSEKVA